VWRLPALVSALQKVVDHVLGSKHELYYLFKAAIFTARLMWVGAQCSALYITLIKKHNIALCFTSGHYEQEQGQLLPNTEFERAHVFYKGKH
jgi:hypothetical protein